jgi:hypothetical protein
VPKVQHKPIKSPRKGSNKIAKDNRKVALVWRTGQSGVPPDSVRCTRELNSKLATFGNSGRPLRYNSPDCPVCQAEQRLQAPTIICNATVNSEQCNCARRSQSKRQKAHRTVNRTCPMHHRTVNRTCPVHHRTVAPLSEAPTVGTQRPGDVAGAPDCPVRHDRSLHQRSFWWLGL